MKHVCVCVCEGGQPVGPDDAFSNGVSYLVEDVFVVRTADEELVLGENTPPVHT